MEDTVFHKIIRREIPAEIVQESDNYIAIRDINPVAPVHILIIPKKTIPSVAHVSSEDAAILGGLLVAAKEIAEEHGLSKNGYRLVINTGWEGQQTVNQIHLHLIGGRQFSWPPG